MIIMDVELDNLLAFKNFHMNMAYPKKIVNSSIPNETLKGYPNFRYKKINIIMGANATGKTSLGKILMSIFNFITSKEKKYILKHIKDRSKSASFAIDYVDDNNELVSVKCKFIPKKVDSNLLSDIYAEVKKVKINKNDSYESCKKHLEEQPYSKIDNYVAELEKASELYWLFQYPNSDGPDIDQFENSSKFLDVLKCVLSALDPSIIDVTKSNEVNNAYIIKMDHSEVIVQQGAVTNENLLSSGTIAGISLAEMITSIIEDKYSFYYCDEKFSYIHSEIEKAILSIMINSLQDDAQLFFTTHNTEIADMPLPKHSFVFLQKDLIDNEMPIKCVYASDYLRRNTDSLRNAIENDLFSTAPAIEKIFEIESIVQRSSHE